MLESWEEAEALRRSQMPLMEIQLVPVPSLWEAWKISHIWYVRQYSSGQHAHVCAKLKTRCEVAASLKGHARLGTHGGV